MSADDAYTANESMVGKRHASERDIGESDDAIDRSGGDPEQSTALIAPTVYQLLARKGF